MPKLSTVTVTVEYGRSAKATRSFVVRSDLELDDNQQRAFDGQRAALGQVHNAFSECYKEACTATVLTESEKEQDGGKKGRNKV